MPPHNSRNDHFQLDIRVKSTNYLIVKFNTCELSVVSLMVWLLQNDSQDFPHYWEKPSSRLIKISRKVGKKMTSDLKAMQHCIVGGQILYHPPTHRHRIQRPRKRPKNHRGGLPTADPARPHRFSCW